LTISQL